MNRPLSICLIAPKAYGLFDPAVASNYGGAEVDLSMLAKELAKDDSFRVRFITADYGQPSEQTLENVHLIKSLTLRENPLAGAWKIWRAMKKADADFYLIKTISPGVPLAWLFCRLYGKKFLYRTAHQDECDRSYRTTRPLLGRLFEFCLRRADRVFTQNQSDGESLRHHLGIESVCIPNGHPIKEVEPRQRRHILWVGRTADFKHPERFLELAGAFPQEAFVMVCRRATGDEGYEEFERQAKAVANLEFHGGVEFAKIAEFFARAKVFVNTSDTEGFANTFIQAAAAGTCILSWTVNPDQFLTRYQCGLACGGDMKKLKAGLAFLLEDERFADIGRNGQAYCREHHDIAVHVETYKRILRELADRAK